MNLSSPRFKALSVSTGISFWFFVIISALGIFSYEIFIPFLVIVYILMQILALKVSKALNLIAIINTKLFLGVLFVCVFSLYGILFRFLKIDLLRIKRHNESYWLEIEKLNDSRILKQY